MGKTFIIIYLICHLAYPTLHKESFRVIQIMSSFTNYKMVNKIRIFTVLWICLGAFTLALFDQFLTLFLLGIGSPSSILLDSLMLLSNSTDLLHFVFPHSRLHYIYGAAAQSTF